jgi:DNA-binding IclR family transcriptional regulator
VIQSFETSQPIQIITQIGSRMPLLSSATGRLFASYQSASQIRPLLDKQWSTTLAVKSVPANWAAFEALQKQIVAQGYATVIGELLMGINAISLPLFNEFGMIEYSVTLIGLQTDLPSEQLDEIAEHLLQLRQAITG